MYNGIRNDEERDGMLKKLIRFAKSPVGRRALLWLGPIVAGLIAERLGKKKSRK
jgi:hypothetical protein